MIVLHGFLVLLGVALANGHSSELRALYAELEEYSSRDPATYWQAIVPGTKWCGDGDKAENNDDLGFFKKTDMCCRDHDLCDDIIPAGESKHGLTNQGRFTRLHCECDFKFFKCLKGTNQPVSYIVGTGYFNGLGGQCYEENYPATCIEYDSILGERCVKYSYDESQPMKWQWFDVPRYIG